MKYPMISEGVYGSRDAIISASREEIDFLLKEAARLPRKRARLCAHHDSSNPVHEMLIAMARETYIVPHAHDKKTESFHVISGEADLVMFDGQGKISGIIELGDMKSGKAFYFRIAEPFFHTVLIHSPFLVIHETTTGPFTPGAARQAAWAPKEGDREASQRYIEELRRRTSALKSKGSQVE